MERSVGGRMIVSTSSDTSRLVVGRLVGGLRDSVCDFSPEVDILLKVIQRCVGRM